MTRQLNGNEEGFESFTPEAILLKSVLENDDINIVRICNSNPHLIRHVYGAEYYKPILLIACSEEQVKSDTVKILIDLGADLSYTSQIYQEWQALHFAAYNTKSETLRVIVENLRNPGDINNLAKGSNALHILIHYGNNNNLEQFVECAKILAQNGIDVNQADKDGISAILWAAKKGFKEIIKVILEESNIQVDVDSHRSKGDTAWDIIERNNLYGGVILGRNYPQNDSDTDILFKFLYTMNEDAFMNFKGGDIFDLVNASDNSFTLLQVCCENRLKRTAEYLINKGANPNSTSWNNGEAPVEITARNGYYEIFEILLDHPEIRISNIIVVTLLKNRDFKESAGKSHRKCWDILLKKLHENREFLDINETDKHKNSPLHYAVQYADPEKVENILQLGAFLGSKNENGAMPIQDIEPDVLKKHLDSCIEFDLNEQNNKKDSLITFSYHTLIPLRKFIMIILSNSDSNRNPNTHAKEPQELVAQTEVISYMSKDPEFTSLFQHPVILSFLLIKWHRIRWFFYTNLALYIAFLLSVVVYIFVGYANFSNAESSSFENFVTNLSYGISALTYILLIFRELFRFTICPKKYFKKFVNYVKIVLILFTGSILFISNLTDDTKRILSSIFILLAIFELMLIVSQHPKLSINLAMSKTNFLIFLKFLIWYSLLIIAFALSFYVLFSETEVDAKNETENNDAKEYFSAASLNFHHFPVMSKIIFVLFVFMIVIILLNLLNGLAVGDTQHIKDNVELVGHIARAEYIRYIERLFLNTTLPRNIRKIISGFYSVSDYKVTGYLENNDQICLATEEHFYKRNCMSCCANICLDKSISKRTNKIIQERRKALKIKNKYNEIWKIEKEISELNKKLDIIIIRSSSSLSTENK